MGHLEWDARRSDGRTGRQRVAAAKGQYSQLDAQLRTETMCPQRVGKQYILCKFNLEICLQQFTPETQVEMVSVYSDWPIDAIADALQQKIETLLPFYLTMSRYEL